MKATIVSRIYRPEPGAASIVLGAAADSLVAAGHDVQVITTKPPKHLDIKNEAPSRVFRFPVLRDKSGYVRGYLQYLSFDIPLFFRLLFMQKPDVLLVEPPPTTGAIARIVCRLRRIPYVYDAADLWSDAAIHATSNKLVVKALTVVEKFAILGSKKLVTVSDTFAQRLQEFAPNKSFEVVGLGADTGNFSYMSAPREKMFIYAGTYTELHGAEILIPAFAKFLNHNPGYKLKFVGNTTLQPEMLDLAINFGVQDSVEFASAIPAHELNKQLNHATAALATLHPDRGYEFAFTSKIFSALSAGCPVIFAGPGPTRKFVINNPESKSVACNYDINELEAALTYFVDNSLDDSSRRQLAEWTYNNCSIQNVAKKIVSVMESVAEYKEKSSET